MQIMLDKRGAYNDFSKYRPITFFDKNMKIFHLYDDDIKLEDTLQLLRPNTWKCVKIHSGKISKHKKCNLC